MFAVGTRTHGFGVLTTTAVSCGSMNSILITSAVVLLLVVALVLEWARPDLAVLGALGLLLGAGILDIEQAFAGFSSSAVVTVASLYVVAAAVHQADALAGLDPLLFGRSTALPRVLLRLLIPTALLSAFVNNTPLVAMLVPRVQSWSRRSGVAASKLLIPLSYAAVVGGTITVLGTSTNLVVSGLLTEATGAGLSLFTITVVGLPSALVAVAYLAFFGHRLLPDRSPTPDDASQLEGYLFEVRVGDQLAGRTVEAAGLRALERAYLVHLHRGDHIVGPVAPTELLQPGDVLAFSGDATVLPELLERPGFERVVESVDRHGTEQLPLFEAVVAPSSSLVGRTLKESDFRTHYGGAVLGIQRGDEAITTRLGRLPLRAGDLLFVEARPGFDQRWRVDRQTFQLVAARMPGVESPRRKKAAVALAIFAVMVATAATGTLSLTTAAFLGALAVVATGCLSMEDARRSLDLPVLLMIGGAFGIGVAVEVSGLAALIADPLVTTGLALGPLATLIAIYAITNLLTELLSNAAAAVLVLPIALASAAALEADPVPFAVVVAVAASAGFATPLGYQTNLMVMSPGGYRMVDYLRAGIPLNLIVGVVALSTVAIVWF